MMKQKTPEEKAFVMRHIFARYRIILLQHLKNVEESKRKLLGALAVDGEDVIADMAKTLIDRYETEIAKVDEAMGWLEEKGKRKTMEGQCLQ